MDAETLTQGEEEGYFYADGNDYWYVFDDPGDHVYGNVLPTEYRGLWKSQWWGYNKLYYNPSLEYEPWAGLPDANPDTPRSHPYYDYDYFNLNATYWKPGVKIVDDYDYGFSLPEGTWSEEWSGEAYDDRFFQTSEVGVQHRARWNPHPNLTPGYYYVYAWWRDTSSYSTSVQYKIYYNVGPGDSTTATTSVYVNQEQNCMQWNQLGSNYYWFGGYDGNKIELIHTPSDDYNHACADAVMFVPVDAIDVKNAHYYTFVDTNGNADYDTGEPVYLVVIEKIDPDIPPDAPEAENNYNIVYYLATITGSGQAEKVTNLVEVPEASVPPSVKSGRSGYEERQNFANWYSFYRRRTFAATSAVSKFILEMQGVQIGFYSIHQRVVQPVLKVKVAGVDETDQLLDLIYSMRVDGMTPLRRGLEAVGRYFHQDDGETGGIGASPFVSSINGGECQQAFAIVMTDGYWNGDDPLGSIGNADSDNGDPYADDYSNTLADIAMYYYENDLADGLADKVPVNPLDDATHQHMVTYGVAFGVYGTLNPDVYDLENGPYPTWPNVYEGYSDSRKIDDLWHAAVNGRGAFLSASDPDELVTGLRNIMQNIESRIASASAISVNGDELYGRVGTDILMFQSTYNPDGWSGDVRAYQLDTASGQVLRESYIWSAAEKLNTMNWTTRKIATWDDIAMIGRDLDFNKLTPVQKTYINSDLTILNFLKGDRTTEVQFGGSFRNRFGVLGDIVHSSPIFQGYASEDGYLFVGANDGMLHCLDAATGVEVFAYVPNLVFPNLAALVDPDYGQSHEYYVNLSPTLQPGVDTGVSTKTLLVGGLGGGGKGYYALDVTDPSAWTSGPAVATKVMWEFGNDPDLGYSYCRPVIVDSNDEDINSHTGWVVIIGNGYNSQNGNAVLLILDPFDGHVLKRIDVGNGPCNALSAPTAVDSNADGKVDYVYAGDLKGNLWKFDLTDSNYANWEVAYKDGAANPKPLFRCPGQPITAQPDVMVHCEKHGYLVIFGTGKYLGESDFSDTSLQSIYGVWDYGDDDDNSEYLGTFTRGATPELSNQPDSVTLVRQTFLPSAEADPHFWTVGDNKVRILTNNNPIWTTTSYDSGGECGEGEGEVGCDPNGVGDKPDPIEHAGWYF
ncbi:MAG: hypothetical protein AMJ46_14550, partial [Latescibacteria bacterium DG_63]